MPLRAPTAGPPLADWLRAPRPEAQPGIWRCGHEPRPPEEPDRIDGRQLLGGAALALILGLLTWSLFWNDYLPFLTRPLVWFTPDHWRTTGDRAAFSVAVRIYQFLIAALMTFAFGRAGRWAEVWRRYCAPLLKKAVTEDPSGRGSSGASAPSLAADDRAAWPEVRAAGEHGAADLLAAEALSGRMNDVDYARIDRAWQGVRAQPARLPDFAEEVRQRGATAYVHPSGTRDLPVRAAHHDLVTGQVRLGAAPDEKRNPYAYRGTAIALEPSLLSTSLLVVGPSGAGKTRKVVRPVVEALSLQALARRTAVVAVGASGAGLGPDDAYDVVIKIGDPDSVYDLDLYGGSTDPDEAAAVLAEALAGDEAEADPRRVATVIAQLIGPFRIAHGRFPSVPELRELADGVPVALASLREACEAAGPSAGAALRELDARERQATRPGDLGAVVADRLALLDRPAFAGFFDASGRTRPFSMRAIDHPLRVRVDLPERGHSEASRLLARLLLAQFCASALARKDQSRFVCLVLDDAAHTLTASSVREIQRLRSAHAGVVLGLRTLDDVPEQLRATVLAAVGCRVALSGLSTWDGEVFAQAWGRDWVETEDITHAPDFHGGLVTRWVRGIRTLFTGVRATAKSVTVRTVQRERWSASDLANDVPPGHAVLSLMTVRGERTPPILAKLGE
ncbi:ATP-binding protein [Streptomyces daliensis]|uniref:ATP-binding protein n=1 Tax=Streptomyces daliensis TaxID=299421 RepID=A0A8T4J0I8_9ACTN|nr:ATP-binding protein [Streptomyces daliensis]